MLRFGGVLRVRSNIGDVLDTGDAPLLLVVCQVEQLVGIKFRSLLLIVFVDVLEFDCGLLLVLFAPLVYRRQRAASFELLSRLRLLEVELVFGLERHFWLGCWFHAELDFLDQLLNLLPFEVRRHEVKRVTLFEVGHRF